MKLTAICMVSAATLLSAAAAEPRLRTLDMVHHNPGEKPTQSKFLDPTFLAAMGCGAKVVNDFQAPQCACTFDEFDPTIFPVGSESRKWVEDFAASCESRAKACHEAGIKCYYFMDIIVLPRELIRKYRTEICGPDGKVSFAREKTWEIHRLMLREMLRRIPSVDGFVIRTGEMYSHNVPYHGGNTPVNYRKDPEGFVKTHARLMNLLREEVCVKANREVIYRTWDFLCFHTRPDIYRAITGQVEPHANLLMSIKHTCGDYLRYTTFNPTLGIGRHRQIVEFQCQREYEGKGAYPNYVVKGTVEGFEENRDVPGRQGLRDLLDGPLFAGVWTWSRGGGWEGPYLRNEFWCELNTYVMTQWARDPSAGEEAAFAKFMEAKGVAPESRAAFRRMALLSADAVVRGLGNLPPESVKACWTRDHFIGDYDWLKTDYARLVTNGLVGVALANKRESVRLWEEIARLAGTVKMADKADEHYLRTSAQYGLRLYRIYEAGWTVTLLGYQGDRTGSYDWKAIADGIRRYDEAWRDYRRLPVEETDCATLFDGWFAAYHISQDHNSIDPAPGMDAEVDRYRKMNAKLGMAVRGGLHAAPAPREQGELFRLDSGDLVAVVPEKVVNFGMGVYHWERVRRPELLSRVDKACGWASAEGRAPGTLDVRWPAGDAQVPALLFLCGEGAAALPDEQVAQAVKRGYAVARVDVSGLSVASAAKTAIVAYDLLRREARVDCAHVGVYGFGATCGQAAFLAGAHEMRFGLAAAVDADVTKELMALQAPHLASVGVSGADVVRARREFDAAVAATPAWYDYGLSGLDITIFPGEDDLNYGGTLEYYRRPGGSAPAVCDLNRILDFCDWRHWRHAPGTPAREERLPDLLTSPKTGRTVTTKEEWERDLRPEIVEFYTREVYGRRPVERPEALTFTPVGADRSVFGGKGIRREVKISFRAKYGEMSFSAVAFLPKRADGKAAPAFLCVTCMDDPFTRRNTFSDETIEMALDRGYAMVGYWGKNFLPDMSLDPAERKGWQGKFVFGNYEKPEERTHESWGAISVWAWTASRVLDWLETVPEVDAARVAVAGNSRAGKTALWAGVTDTRFAMVCPNCSGCLGARLSHVDLDGVERMGPLMRLQTYWFCDNIWKWSDTDRFEFPYDQHQLAACVAPRLLVVGTGSDDIGAGPEGEFLMARAASPAWGLYGMKGLSPDAAYPGVDSNLITEGVGFHRRPGGHFLGYGNWKRYMDFADAHGWGIGAAPRR